MHPHVGPQYVRTSKQNRLTAAYCVHCGADLLRLSGIIHKGQHAASTLQGAAIQRRVSGQACTTRFTHHIRPPQTQFHLTPAELSLCVCVRACVCVCVAGWQALLARLKLSPQPSGGAKEALRGLRTIVFPERLLSRRRLCCVANHSSVSNHRWRTQRKGCLNRKEPSKTR